MDALGRPATGAGIDSLSHFSWHAALHELTLGDLDAVRRRYDAQLRPEHGLGCRALVDSGSLLFRWALTPGATDVPGLDQVAAVTGPGRPRAAGHAVPRDARRGHAAGPRRRAGLRRAGRLGRAARPAATQREVVAPLVRRAGR